jgi:hypothetical protein
VHSLVLPRSGSGLPELPKFLKVDNQQEAHLKSSAGNESLRANLLLLLTEAATSSNELDRLHFIDNIVNIIDLQMQSSEDLVEFVLQQALEMTQEEQRLRALETLCAAFDHVNLPNQLPRIRLEVAKAAEMLGRTTQAQSYYLSALKESANNGSRSVAIEAIESLYRLLEDENVEVNWHGEN